MSVFTSCQSDLMDLSPEGSVSSGNMWITENLSDLGVTGIYNALFFGDVAKEVYKYDCLGVTSYSRDANMN